MLKHYTDLEIRVREFARSAARKQDGASAVEYGLLVALIIFAAVALFGTNATDLFSSVSSGF